MKLSYSDKQHAYRVDGVRYKSITAVAGIPDDTYNLQLWGKRMTALGMALSPPLIERAIAHFDDRTALNDIADDALRAAKAHEAAARGTAAHRTLERHDLGEELIETAENKALRAAYDKALAAAGLVVVPEYIERIVLFPKHGIAGRFDRLMKRKRDGKLVVADLKTGDNAVKYPHKTAIQLSLYAHAELMAGPIPNGGGETEDFQKLPDNVDKTNAYVIHAPSNDSVEVVKINISHAYKIFEKSIVPILAWRKRGDLITPLGTTAVADVSEPADPERLSWIKGRLAVLGMMDDDTKKLVGLRWPADVPTPKSGLEWTDYHLDALDVMLASVEKDRSASFPTKDPAFKEMEHA